MAAFGATGEFAIGEALATEPSAKKTSRPSVAKTSGGTIGDSAVAEFSILEGPDDERQVKTLRWAKIAGWAAIIGAALAAIALIK